MRPVPTEAPPRGLALANVWFTRHSVLLLLALVALNLLFPEPGLALRRLQLFRIPLAGWSYDFSTLALTLMMLSAAVQCRFEDFRQLRHRPRAGAASLAIVYGVGPVLALLSGVIGLGPAPGEAAAELRVGLFLVALMPVAMTAVVWVRGATGNVALLLALIALTTTLSVFSVPLYSQILPALGGKALETVPVGELIRQLVLSVTLPLAAGLALRHWANPRAERLQPLLAFLGNLGLFAALSTNVAGASASLFGDLELILVAGLATVALNIAFMGIALAWARHLRTRLPGLSHEDAVTLFFGAGMRSTGTAMVLASAAFPAMPLVVVPAAIYSISQQIVAGYLSRVLQPGSILLRTPVGRGRRDLEIQLRRLVLERAGNLTLLLFRIDPRLQACPLKSLVPVVRRRLRGHDYVSLLQPDQFAIVLAGVPETMARPIAARVESALRTWAPDLPIEWGVAQAQTPAAATRLLDTARAGVVRPRLRVATGLHVVRREAVL